jgi:hypothetical protein
MKTVEELKKSAAESPFPILKQAPALEALRQSGDGNWLLENPERLYACMMELVRLVNVNITLLSGKSNQAIPDLERQFKNLAVKLLQSEQRQVYNGIRNDAFMSLIDFAKEVGLESVANQLSPLCTQQPNGRVYISTANILEFLA